MSYIVEGKEFRGGRVIVPPDIEAQGAAAIQEYLDAQRITTETPASAEPEE